MPIYQPHDDSSGFEQCTSDQFLFFYNTHPLFPTRHTLDHYQATYDYEITYQQIAAVQRKACRKLRKHRKQLENELFSSVAFNSYDGEDKHTAYLALTTSASYLYLPDVYDAFKICYATTSEADVQYSICDTFVYDEGARYDIEYVDSSWFDPGSTSLDTVSVDEQVNAAQSVASVVSDYGFEELPRPRLKLTYTYDWRMRLLRVFRTRSRYKATYRIWLLTANFGEKPVL